MKSILICNFKLKQNINWSSQRLNEHVKTTEQNDTHVNMLINVDIQIKERDGRSDKQTYWVAYDELQ